MRIDIIAAQPNLLGSPFGHSILKRAIDAGVVEIHIHDLRNYGLGKHKQIDDYAFGGGAGMVLMMEPLSTVIDELQSENKYDEIIYLTPDGETLNQGIANSLSLSKNIMMICGHYKGIDDRIRQKYVTKEISIGDYVLSGGELAAAVLCDAVIRLIPKVLNDETSALTDTFQDHLLAPPVYTRPAEFDGMQVPDLLTSGNTKAIDEWRLEQSIERTKNRRPDLYKKYLGEEE